MGCYCLRRGEFRLWDKNRLNQANRCVQDSTPKCRVLPSPRSKLHQIKYITIDPTSDQPDLLAVSTEDGRVIFYSTTETQKPEDDADSPIPLAVSVAELGGKPCGLPGRVKDFEIFNLKEYPAAKSDGLLVVTGNSAGSVRIWSVDAKDLTSKGQVGKLLNTYETTNRITCLKSFVMLPSEDPSTLEDLDEDDDDEEDEEEDSSDDSSSEDSDAE